MYDGFSDELFRFCLSKTRNRDESLDIVQETFVKTWDYLRQGKTIEMARPFLYRTLRNIIIDRSRKKKPLSLDSFFETDETYEIPDESAVPTGTAYDRELLLARLKQLPEPHYEILVLRFIQELTISEIAGICNESENAVSVRIHRAIKHAQKLFGDQETYDE